ncbi:hypothetical protein CLOM_g13750 [Closterium sp. NIES-68]|nr:hypothetical protein CLOM_g13750 [Closterium sp. NIES-68]GJP63650.1 hypothetical protein CLOP_g20716 [Closterium sp. NIES-67]GJP69441.1 hypothetical protein CLOP_g434 [Closterium sp. NIES-67]
MAFLALHFILLSLLPTLLVRAGDVPGEAESLPGWKGATYVLPPGLRGRERDTANESPGLPEDDLVQVEQQKRHESEALPEPAEQPAQGDSSGGSDPSGRAIIQLSADEPRAYLFKRFLTDEECDHIIALAEPSLERSTVIADSSSGSEVSEIRTSFGTFIDKKADAVIERVERRIEAWTHLPVSHQEALQVLRYNVGQKYVPHHDYFSDPPETLQGGHRLATVLMYLSNVTKGGETVFSNVPDPTPKDHSWSDCAKGYLAVKPVKGDALLFFSMHPDGTPDEASMHYACPVVEGVKWSAPKWIHVREFDVAGEEGDPSVCADTNGMCDAWAAAGECETNKNYMEGGKTFVGACRKACGVCKPDSSNGTAVS